MIMTMRGIYGIIQELPFLMGALRDRPIGNDDDDDKVGHEHPEPQILSPETLKP